jgi:hypothetical protein
MSEGTWKDIPGFTGYQASHRGAVRSVDRVIKGRFCKGVMLAMRPGTRGYLVTNLLDDEGQRKTREVHSLVMLAHVGNRPRGQQVRHGKGGKLDNRWPENLCYGTPAENEADKGRPQMVADQDAAAAAWLAAYMEREDGFAPVEEILAAAAAEGFGMARMYRARLACGMVSAACWGLRDALSPATEGDRRECPDWDSRGQSDGSEDPRALSAFGAVTSPSETARTRSVTEAVSQ